MTLRVMNINFYSFKFMVGMFKGDKLIKTAICRHEGELRRVINRFKGVK